MGAIIQLNNQQPVKFGFRKAKRGKPTDLETHGQLNLFSNYGRHGRVVQMKPAHTPFEQALTLDENKDGKAREAYLAAIEAGDCIADAYCNLGIIEFQEGNAVKAIDCFTLSLKHEPRHFESHYNLANLYSDLGNLALAKIHYKMAAELQPDFPNIYFNLALVNAITNDFAGAVTALKQYKELVPAAESGNADDLLETLQRSLAHR